MKDSKNKKDPITVSLPTDTYPGDLTSEGIEGLIEKKSKGHDSLGKDPKSGQPIYVLTGRYGPYVQRGDVKEDKKDVKRVSIPKGLEEDIDFNTALKLLELPKVLGEHPKTEKEIKKGIGRFGPYIVHDGDFRSVRNIQDFFNLNLKKAIEILNEPKKGRKKTVLKEVGAHPETGKEIQLLDGKFGPYVQYMSQKVSLPRAIQPQSLTLKQALELLKFEGKGSKGKASQKGENGVDVVKKKSGLNKKLSMSGVKRKNSKKTYKADVETVS